MQVTDLLLSILLIMRAILSESVDLFISCFLVAHKLKQSSLTALPISKEGLLPQWLTIFDSLDLLNK